MEFRKLDVFLCVCLAIFSVVARTAFTQSAITTRATTTTTRATTTTTRATTTARPTTTTTTQRQPPSNPGAPTGGGASQPGPGSGGSGGSGGLVLSNCGMGCKGRLDPQSVNVIGANFKGMGSGSASGKSLGIWSVVTAVFIVSILLLH